MAAAVNKLVSSLVVIVAGTTLTRPLPTSKTGVSSRERRADAPEIDGMVLIEGKATVGEIVPVRIGGAMAYDLTGVLAQPQQHVIKL